MSSVTPVPAKTGTDAGASTAESPAINELAAALAKAQGAFSNPAKDRDNPFFGSRYATLGAVIEATRGPLAGNGLSLTQTIGGGHGGRAPLLRTRLLHASGQWLASEVPLFAAGKGSQAFGSELTYMRRYAVCALLNIAPAEGDDDGNAAQAATSASPARQGERSGDGTGGSAAPSAGSSAASSPRSRGSAKPKATAQADAAPTMPPASPPREAAGPARRAKDEPAPSSVWGILRPGKAAITAPDPAAWLRWWTSIAGKAVAGGQLDELRALQDANVVAWDEIAISSAEAHDVVAEAIQAVKNALGD